MSIADYRDLIKRHEAVSSLVGKAKAEIFSGEGLLATAPSAVARRLEIDLINKRRFLRMLETRLAVLAAELEAYKRQEQELLARLAGKSPS